MAKTLNSEILEIVLKGGQPWGFTLQGGSEVRSSLAVAEIIEGGKADYDGHLCVGDIILSVNDVTCYSKSEAGQLIKSAFKTLTLQVWRGNIREREQQRSDKFLQRADDTRVKETRDDSVVYTGKRPVQTKKMRRGESFSVGQKRPKTWQRENRENLGYQSDLQKSTTLPLNYPASYPTGTLSPDEDLGNNPMLRTAPAGLTGRTDNINVGHNNRNLPSAKSASHIEREAMRQSYSVNPRPYQGPKPYQSMSALNTAGMDSKKSVYDQLSNKSGIDFSPRKQKNPVNDTRHVFNQEHTEEKARLYHDARTFQQNYVNIPNVPPVPHDDDTPPEIPPPPKMEDLRFSGLHSPTYGGPLKAGQSHEKYPSWPVTMSGPEPKSVSHSSPIDTPPVRDFHNEQDNNSEYSAGDSYNLYNSEQNKYSNSEHNRSYKPYQPALNTVKETNSPIANRKERRSDNLVSAKKTEIVYQARIAKVINTSLEEESLRNLLTNSKPGYPPPKVDSHGKEIGDQDYVVPSPPERDVPIEPPKDAVEEEPHKFSDLLKHYSKLEADKTKIKTLRNKDNKKDFKLNTSPSSMSQKSSHTTHLKISVATTQSVSSGTQPSPMSVSTTIPSSVGIDTVTQPSPPHRLQCISSQTTQTSPLARSSPVDAWTNEKQAHVVQATSHIPEPKKKYQESSSQVSPPFNATEPAWGLNSLLSDKDLLETEGEDAKRIISKWELEKEQRERKSKNAAVDVITGALHIRQYSENTAPMLHRLTTDGVLQQQIQKQNELRQSHGHRDKGLSNHSDQMGENEPIYATIDEQSPKPSKYGFLDSQTISKEIKSSKNYVNISTPTPPNYINIKPGDDLDETTPKAAYAAEIEQEELELNRVKTRRDGISDSDLIGNSDNSGMLRTWHGHSQSYSQLGSKQDDLYRIEEHGRSSLAKNTSNDNVRSDFTSRRMPENNKLKRTTSEQIRPLKDKTNSLPRDSYPEHRYSETTPKGNYATQQQHHQRQSSRSGSYRERIQTDKQQFQQHAEKVRGDKKQRPLSANFDDHRDAQGSGSDPELKKVQKQALLDFFHNKTGVNFEGSTMSLASADSESSGDRSREKWGSVTLPPGWVPPNGRTQIRRPDSLSREDPQRPHVRHIHSAGQLSYNGFPAHPPTLRRSESVSSSQSRSGSTASSGGYSPNRMSWDRGDVFRPQSTSSDKSPISPVQHPQSEILMNTSSTSSQEDDRHKRLSSSGVFEPGTPSDSGSKNQFHSSYAPIEDERPPLPPRNYSRDVNMSEDQRRAQYALEQQKDWQEFIKHKRQNGYEDRFESPQRNGYPHNRHEETNHDHNRNRGKSYENVPGQDDDFYAKQLRQQARRMSQNQRPPSPANYKREMVPTNTKSEVIKSKPVDTRPKPQEAYSPSLPPKGQIEPARPPKSHNIKTHDRRSHSPDFPPPPIEETDMDAVMAEENLLPPPPPPKDYSILQSSPRDSLSSRSSSTSRGSPAMIAFPPPPPSDKEDKGSQTDEDEIDNDYPKESYMAKKTSKPGRSRHYGNYHTRQHSDEAQLVSQEHLLNSTAPGSLETVVKPTKTITIETQRLSPVSSNEHSPHSSPGSTAILVKSSRARTRNGNTSYETSPTVRDHSPNMHALPPRERQFKPIDSQRYLPPKTSRRHSEQPPLPMLSQVDGTPDRRKSVGNYHGRKLNGSSEGLSKSKSNNSSITESTESLEGVFSRTPPRSLEKLNSTTLSSENINKSDKKNTSGASSPCVNKESDKPLTPQPGLSVKHIRNKSQEELLCEEEAARLANQIKEQDSKLSQVLSPVESRKTATDYMEGIITIDPEVHHRRQSSMGKSSPKSGSPKPACDKDGRLTATPTGDKKSDSPIPPSSPYWMPSPNQNNKINRDQIIQDICNAENLHKKKEELASRIQKKLDILRQEKENLNTEVNDNEELGKKVFKIVEANCNETEVEKYKLYVEESEKCVKLLLKLSGWLARAENALLRLPEDASKAEKDKLLERKETYASRHEDARNLKEGIDKRYMQVSNFLENYMSEQEQTDFKHFTNMRLTLICQVNEVEDNIQMDTDQLNELKKSMNP